MTPCIYFVTCAPFRQFHFNSEPEPSPRSPSREPEKRKPSCQDKILRFRRSLNHTCVCMYIYIYVYTYIYIYINAHTHTHTFVYSDTHAHSYIEIGMSRLIHALCSASPYTSQPGARAKQTHCFLVRRVSNSGTPRHESYKSLSKVVAKPSGFRV